MAGLSKLKPVIIGLVGLGVIWLIYLLATNANFTKNVTLRADEVRAKADKLDQELLKQLDDVEKLVLDGAFFASEEWQQLIDYSRPLGQPVRGRPDPFAPFTTTPRTGS